MWRSRRAHALFLVLALLGSSPDLVAFQSFVPLIDSWTYVTGLPRGTFVRVTEAPRQRTAGKLIHVDDTTIVVEEGIQPTTILRANIVEVERRLPNHDVRNAFIGGAAFGFVNAVLTLHHLNWTSLAFGAFLTFGDGGIAAVFGGLSSLVDRHYVVVCRRP